MGTLIDTDRISQIGREIDELRKEVMREVMVAKVKGGHIGDQIYTNTHLAFSKITSNALSIGLSTTIAMCDEYNNKVADNE